MPEDICQKCYIGSNYLRVWKSLHSNLKDRMVCEECYVELEDYYSARIKDLARPAWRRLLEKTATVLLYIFYGAVGLMLYNFLTTH